MSSGSTIPQFLGRIGVEKLTQLSLGENAKKNFDLAPLGGCQHLKRLFVLGHTKNIGAISTLPELVSVSLSGFPKHHDLRFLRATNPLRSLTLILGGRFSLDEFDHPALEELSIHRVRGLQSIGSLDRFPRLRRLHVEDQLQLRSIDLAGALLRQLILMNCKNLTQVDGIQSLNELAELRVSRTKLDLDALMERDWPASLRVLALYSTSQKWNDTARAILDQRGYREF